MGKASRWMINFLLGKREGKEAKKSIAFYEENVTHPNANSPVTSSFRMQWSFRRLASKGRERKSSKPITDSINATPLITNTMVELERQKVNILAAIVSDKANKAIEDEAATKIQTAFRSHLARKALRALRGLVKLQAVVRGHLVRKQATATLRSMHALMTIQVRARFQRIQMAEESQLGIKSQLLGYKHFANDEVKRTYRETIDTNRYGAQEALMTKQNHSKVRRIEHGITTYYAGDLSLTTQEHQNEAYPFARGKRNPQDCITATTAIPARASFTYPQPEHPCHLSHEYQLMPNYMANTKSSSAKNRSQSEPKQRPKGSMKSVDKETAAMEEKNVLIGAQSEGSTSSHLTRIDHDNHDPQFIKLYSPTRSIKGTKSYASSTIMSNSKYCRSLLAYKPHVTLY